MNVLLATFHCLSNVKKNVYICSVHRYKPHEERFCTARFFSGPKIRVSRGLAVLIRCSWYRITSSSKLVGFIWDSRVVGSDIRSIIDSADDGSADVSADVSVEGSADWSADESVASWVSHSVSH